ncbi:helix-turn-helix domain-containing protein [Nitratireductor aquibiodomus]|nr:AraC family transcriptional regulator [Nitratireductor aquibiodomus]
MHKSGARCLNVGLSLSHECIQSMLEDYGEESMGAIARFPEGTGDLRTLHRSGELASYLNGMVAPAQHHGRLSALQFEGGALALLAAINRIAGENDRMVASMGRRERDRVHAVRELLEANIDTPPTLAELSRRVGVNVTTLSQQFRQAFGYTIFGYLRVRRLEHAQQLLRETDLPVSQVAYRVGFSNPGAFATAYRRHFGHVPRDEPRPIAADGGCSPIH